MSDKPISDAAQAPVAWEYQNRHGNTFLTHDDPNQWHPRDKEYFSNFRALMYASPVIQVETEPTLTDDEILDEYSKHVHTTYAGGVNVLSAMEPDGFIKAVRAILATHSTK